MVLLANKLSRYKGNKRLVDGINIKLSKGECLGILGPNGAGKTTTLEMLEGVQKPDSGEILFNNRPLKQVDKQYFGIQFQATTLPDYLNVKECIKLYQSFFRNFLSLEKLLFLCQLEGLEERLHSHLSGGERQRLLLALSLVNDPLILFLDEPTTGLDPAARMRFWSILEKIKADNKSIILTTHYMHEAEYLCDNVMVLNNGQVIAEGAPKALLKQHFKPLVASVQSSCFSSELPDFKSQDMIEMDSADQVNQLLKQNNLNCPGINLRKPNLDDLFVKLTEAAC